MMEPILKDHSGESRRFTQRVVIAGVLVLAAMLIVIARLVQLQIGNYTHLSTLSRYNQVKLEPLSPTRGLIYDANGILLADNYSSRSLEIIPEEIQDLDATVAEIGKFIDIGETDLKRFARMRKQRRRFEEIPIRTNLTQKEVARFAVKGHHFPGVAVHARLLRTYPLGEHTAHVLSYVGRINEQELKRINASNYAGTNHIGKGGGGKGPRRPAARNRGISTGRGKRRGPGPAGVGTAPPGSRAALAALLGLPIAAGRIRRLGPPPRRGGGS